MKLDDLMELKLKDVIEDYSLLCNYECGFNYGICKNDVIDDMFERYNVEEYEEAMGVEPLIDFDILYDDEDLISEDKIDRIMDNLGISKKA